MIELVLAIFVIPKIIAPLAKAKGRSSLRWILLAVSIFFITEILIVTVYFSTYALLAGIFNWQRNAFQVWMTSLIYIIALIGGLGSTEAIRRYLSRGDSENFVKPPEPPDFS